MTKKRPFFTKPAGGSELFSIGNTSHGTTSAIVCELCDTSHPERHPNDDTYLTFKLFGRTGILECCGSVMDGLYREWGGKFMEHTLDEFGRSPLDPKFGFLRFYIQNAVKKWQQAAVAAAEQSHEVAAAVPDR